MKIDPRSNVVTRLEGTKIIIEIETDPAKVEPVLSASGKTRTVGTTGGFAWNTVKPGLGINLTVSAR
jgi:hypothetical protein